MEPQYINNLGNWQPYTQDEFYLANIPIKIMKVMSGVSENNKFHYNIRTVPKPPDKLQRLIFPFIEKCKISLNALDASYPNPIDCAILDFMDRGRTVLLQFLTQMVNISRTHILFDNEVFKTELFFNYKETMGTFCIKSVDQLSQSLKALLP